jgi:hypothetical protein
MPYPRGGRSHDAGNLLQAELLQEKAANLGRLARRLERALEALAVHDARGPSRETSPAGTSSGVPGETSGVREGGDDQRRKALLADAGEALFLYVVQREVLGLRGTAQALDDMRVPREVRLRMAPRSVLLAR